MCAGTPVADGSACDDGSQCTVDGCQSGACVGVPMPGRGTEALDYVAWLNLSGEGLNRNVYECFYCHDGLARVALAEGKLDEALKEAIKGAEMARHNPGLVALIDTLELDGMAIVGQDWGGPQGTGAALERLDRVAALTLMNTWVFTDVCGPFHASPLPWTSRRPRSTPAPPLLCSSAGWPPQARQSQCRAGCSIRLHWRRSRVCSGLAGPIW